jgi:uncharacterized OB-fold protein
VKVSALSDNDQLTKRKHTWMNINNRGAVGVRCANCGRVFSIDANENAKTYCPAKVQFK